MAPWGQEYFIGLDMCTVLDARVAVGTLPNKTLIIHLEITNSACRKGVSGIIWWSVIMNGWGVMW